MLRCPYARASVADRARIQCADDGSDWKQLCATLQVNPKTAYDWVKAGAEERRPTSDGRRKALTEEQVDALEETTITLNALKERLLNDFEVRVSVSSIHSYLEGRLFTVKKVHYQMVEANNPRNKALRLEYVQHYHLPAVSQFSLSNTTHLSFQHGQTISACFVASLHQCHQLPACSSPTHCFSFHLN